MNTPYVDVFEGDDLGLLSVDIDAKFDTLEMLESLSASIEEFGISLVTMKLVDSSQELLPHLSAIESYDDLEIDHTKNEISDITLVDIKATVVKIWETILDYIKRFLRVMDKFFTLSTTKASNLKKDAKDAKEGVKQEEANEKAKTSNADRKSDKFFTKPVSGYTYKEIEAYTKAINSSLSSLIESAKATKTMAEVWMENLEASPSLAVKKASKTKMTEAVHNTGLKEMIGFRLDPETGGDINTKKIVSTGIGTMKPKTVKIIDMYPSTGDTKKVLKSIEDSLPMIVECSKVCRESLDALARLQKILNVKIRKDGGSDNTDNITVNVKRTHASLNRALNLSAIIYNHVTQTYTRCLSVSKKISRHNASGSK